MGNRVQPLKRQRSTKILSEEKTCSLKTHLEAPGSTAVHTETQKNFNTESKRGRFPSDFHAPQFTPLKS